MITAPVLMESVQIRESAVSGVKLYRLPLFQDHRGNLTVAELGTVLPFVPMRYFITYAVPGQNIRGEHAHRECFQFLTCVHGSCRVRVDDGSRSDEFLLDDPTLGVLVPPMTWAAEFGHSAESVLLVLASHRYDPGDYLRDYPTFVALAAQMRKRTQLGAPSKTCRS
jgi:UDP-2-acetamido-3-amino-2,3-dideoxy-glucuronate N-acetyltransferase